MLYSRFKSRFLVFPAVFSVVFLFLLLIFHASARADSLNQHTQFNVNSDYDRFGRTSLSATLIAVTDHAYLYVEDQYLSQLSAPELTVLTSNVNSLGREFENVIYPRDTSFWGSEPNPGVDGDPHITILLESLKRGAGGYFDSRHEYPKSVNADSNAREMITLSIESQDVGIGRFFLAHEMQHLISFNQKESLRNVSEDTWLNELRSQYAITAVGYNDDFANSDLAQRKRIFLANPSDSIPEWPNNSTDYAVATLFGQYLVEHYGPGILNETLKSNLVGIDSINSWLAGHDSKERFVDIVGQWAVADMLNSTSSDPRYGYLNPNLRDIHVAPSADVILPYPGSVDASYFNKPFQPAWYRFDVNPTQASDQVIKLRLNIPTGFYFFYFDNLGRVAKLAADSFVDNPGGLQYFVIIPVNASKTSGFGQVENSTPFSIHTEYVPASSQTNLTPAAASALNAQVLADGALIKRPGESEVYVIEGKYKRYLRPEVIAMYGHLTGVVPIEVGPSVFDSYISANYVREVNDKRVYAVWPPGEGSRGAGIASDGTKHWLNMTAQTFTLSGRDWNSIFIINEREFNFYKIGTDIRI